MNKKSYLRRVRLPRTSADWLEAVMNFLFFLCGMLAVCCVVLISVYMVVSGVPAIHKIGIFKFLFGTKWASTAAEPLFGILPFILSSVYGTLGATILGVPDGLLVQNGQPYEFTGYVDGYDEKIASVEFSLDRGETWTKYDIGDMDRNKMVWWSFTYKPELEGAYCLTVRATTESGMTSFETQTVMFNAKDKMPNPEDTTVLESASLIPPKVAAASDEKSE